MGYTITSGDHLKQEKYFICLGEELGLMRKQKAKVGFCVWLIGMVSTVPLFLISDLASQMYGYSTEASITCF